MPVPALRAISEPLAIDATGRKKVGDMGGKSGAEGAIQTAEAGLARLAANDGTMDEPRLIQLVLQGSVAAQHKGLWSLSRLFLDWAHEMQFGPHDERTARSDGTGEPCGQSDDVAHCG